MSFRFITKARLAQVESSLATLRKRAILETARTRAIYSTFLSHSTRDEAQLASVIKILEDEGAAVYIDKIDTSLPPATSRATADGLKRRIRLSSKFILLASSHSKDSRWVPWELGIADGFKGSQHVAVLPAVDSATDKDWAEWEYLGIYDRIVEADIPGYSTKQWAVLKSDLTSVVKLSAWLAS